jgi:hypothetical protein
MEYQRWILEGAGVDGILEMDLGGWSCRWNTRDGSWRMDL